MTNRNEQEWWMESPFCDTYRVPQFDPGIAVTLNQTLHVEKIVAEAERRGRVAAWEEAKEIANDLTPFHITREYRDTDAMRDQLVSVFNAKLTELKKV